MGKLGAQPLQPQMLHTLPSPVGSGIQISMEELDSLGSPSVQHICGTLTKHSEAGMVAVLKDKLIRAHMTLHFGEHSQLDTGWFLSARVGISPSQAISVATYGFSRAAEHST